MLRMRRTRGRRMASLRSHGRWARRLWDGFLAVAVLGLLFLLAARLDPGEMHAVEGRATVNDGDTITLGAERIRLRGIDAPEFDQQCRSGGTDYACGRRSREALVALIGGRPVSCSGDGRDRYGRILAVCSVGGVNINSRQVETGWAIAYGDYRSEEDVARRNAVGLWTGSFDNPGDWRAMHGGMVEPEHVLPGFLDWVRGLFRLS